MYICVTKRKRMNNSNITINYPEMWGSIESEIQAEYCRGKYRVTSKNELPIKKGVTANGIVSEFGANNTPNKRKGWYSYYMTDAAFDRFSKSNKVTLNCLL